MVIKKAISMREDVFDFAFSKAQRFFQGNFSAYVCYLIAQDKECITGSTKAKVDHKVKTAIDEIMNI